MYKPKKISDNSHVALVLATKAVSKQNVLKSMNIDFDVDPANIDERAITAPTPTELVETLAIKKAQKVASRHTNSLILAADTMIVYEGELIGQSANEHKAKETLKKLSGQSHSSLTGLGLIDQTSDMVYSKVFETKIVMRSLSDDEIDNYIASGEAVGKAGSYALQGVGAMLIERLEGEHTSVIGMPSFGMIQLFKEAGYTFL